MKRNGTYTVLMLLVAVMAASPLFAQNQPAAKATAKMGEIAVLDAAVQALQVDPWQTIMRSTLKTSSQKNVFVTASLECGLRTRTLVKSKGGNKDSATAEAGVKIRILVDGQEAYPGDVTFCQRKQELSAVFGGVLDSCIDKDGNGIVTILECDLLDEELELVLETMGAHAFSFASHELSSGVHTIEVQALLSNYAEAGAGEAEAKAVLGKGSVTVEEIRLAIGDDLEL